MDKPILLRNTCIHVYSNVVSLFKMPQLTDSIVNDTHKVATALTFLLRLT